MASTDLCFLPATALAAAIRAREVSPVEVVDAVLARIERLNPALGAYITVTADQARADARRAETAVTRGEPLGPIHGVPVGIKDLINMRGAPNTRGSLIYKDYWPEEDAPSVARLRAAGGILLGKTNTPEFGHRGSTDNRVYGPCRNPWRLDRTPGGSSGGAAAAAAAGLGQLQLGTDGAGSVRIPAAFSGIVGLKPQHGRVPVSPTGYLESISHVGPMARTVRDVALMLDVIAGPDDRDRFSLPASGASYLRACEGGIQGLRVAWSPDLGYATAAPEILRLCQAAAQRFAELGAHVEEASPGFPDPHAEIEYPIFYGGLGTQIRDLPREQWPLLDPLLLEIERETRGLTFDDWIRAQMARARLWDTTRRFFERYDLLLTPTEPIPAFDIRLEGPSDVLGRPGARLAWTPFTYPFNLTQQPAISVPCGFTSEGLPAGLQIVGRRHDEATVLRAAAAYEDSTDWKERRPPEELPG